jgi:hypothetical protein
MYRKHHCNLGTDDKVGVPAAGSLVHCDQTRFVNSSSAAVIVWILACGSTVGAPTPLPRGTIRLPRGTTPSDLVTNGKACVGRLHDEHIHHAGRDETGTMQSGTTTWSLQHVVVFTWRTPTWDNGEQHTKGGGKPRRSLAVASIASQYPATPLGQLHSGVPPDVVQPAHQAPCAQPCSTCNSYLVATMPHAHVHSYSARTG